MKYVDSSLLPYLIIFAKPYLLPLCATCVAVVNSIRPVDVHTPRDPDALLDMLVVPSGLSGMSALWNVALEAQDPVVVSQATKLLNRTHQVSFRPYEDSNIILWVVSGKKRRCNFDGRN